ncbi:MAG TPA: HD-GYP domain-containing protein [Spirochaetota bacterium]|mgnify:CR=1 FL=1|nr:HD-GYP domain-containing protein [Spirochaetota bacterium]HPJ42490.1 HD-GYP domain-containing protein [Spirochaetota bacterium]HPR37423.1 HD-GYP domain-containing protein [Spirochaetota bacterium]HRX47320.1 HD-GYP domain-containing protein [Spirochaetota bacterium]
MQSFRNIDFHGFVEGLIKTIELRDLYTSGHSKRVSEIAELISHEMNMPAKECEYMHIAGHLHDIGKIGIPDGILLKTGKLNEAEYFLMQQHSAIGASIFENLEGFEMMAQIIRHHHERFDGMGYPDRLKGYDIPLGAAIISIADSFDAMTTSRTYRSGISIDEALHDIRINSGKQFNPGVADAFFRVIKKKENRINLIINSYKSHKESVYIPFNSIRTAHNLSQYEKNDVYSSNFCAKS